MQVPFQKHLNLLQSYVVPHRKKLLFIVTLIFLNVGVKVVNPMIIRFYLDSVTKVADVGVLRNASLLFIAMAVIQEAMYITNVYLSADLAWLSTNSLRLDLFRHTAKLDMSFHNQYKPGEMIERVDGDVNAISNFLSVFFLMIVSNILLILGILVAIFWTNLTMGMMFTALVIIAFFLMVKVRLFAIEAWKESRQSTSELMGFIEETLGGIEELKANAGEHHVFDRFHSFSRNEYQATTHAVLRSRVTDVVTYFVIGMGTTLIFALGVPMVQDRVISVGTLYLYTYYFSLLFEPIFQILRQIQQLQLADASVDRINNLFLEESSLQDRGEEMITEDSVMLEFKDLYFAYSDEEFVLKGVSFQLNPGESMGLIGKTGSGKSTVARLIFRLYDYQRGEILINGVPIRDYRLESLRRNIGIVTQEVELFNASIRDNVTFFNREIPDETVLRVLRYVGLGEWLSEQKEGLDTVLTKSGLSAGQAQLLAFARAFLEQPKLVVLDEASSRLDPATETLIDDATRKLLEGRTSIIIAHRLETLQRVDKILILEDGEVVEAGYREELVADPNSRYARLLEVGLEEVIA